LPDIIQRWRCDCAYDGTEFSGWQKQPDGKAVQDHINAALEEVFHHSVKTVGAGRTDAGVHAKNQVFHFDKDWVHGEEAMIQAIRSHLPKGISPRKIRKVGPRFHAHLSARGKQYRYRTVKGWAMPQDERIYAVSEKTKIIQLRIWSRRHNFFWVNMIFLPFAASRGKDVPENPLKHVWKVDITARGEKLDFVIEGSGFLYKMVRSMVGALLDVGSGKLAPEEINQILKSGKRTEVVVSAPAHGLSLEKVFYRRKV
jgi:tRNA pseudouridine38-40 synthase